MFPVPEMKDSPQVSVVSDGSIRKFSFFATLKFQSAILKRYFGELLKSGFLCCTLVETPPEILLLFEKKNKS